MSQQLIISLGTMLIICYIRSLGLLTYYISSTMLVGLQYYLGLVGKLIQLMTQNSYFLYLTKL